MLNPVLRNLSIISAPLNNQNTNTINSTGFLKKVERAQRTRLIDKMA